ncbi:MAG TPA: AAA family ATPase [Nocardioidaceae bacterium]|nr:AAA family ATPase [Nocardioidaceae bacterium]
MPIIVESQAATAETFVSAVGRDASVVATLEELKQGLTADGQEFAIILGPSVDLEAAAALADTLRITRPPTSVILIRRRVETSVLAEALRSGMREVVEERDLTGLGAAVSRAEQIWQALSGPQATDGAPGGRQITIFSPKGGVGKTTLAVNLAIALADHGSKRVCLVDLDLGFGDVAITLQLFPARTLADAVPMGSGLDIGLLETLLTPHRDELMTLVAPVQPDAKDSIPAPLIGKVLRLLKSSFEYVVVDTSPSFDEHVLAAFDETDEMLLVTTLDVPTLKNVKIAVETLDLLNFPRAQRHLIVNRADEKVGLTTEEVESTLGMKVGAAIPTSAQVPNSTNSGEPIVGTLPRHAVSRAIAGLAGAIAGIPVTVDAPRSRSSRAAAPRRSRLRRSGR